LKTAIASAGNDDVVLIAGKGHESYQETAGTRRAFDDMQHARLALEAMPRMEAPMSRPQDAEDRP